ncbi:X-domain of DnaJ-containing-domain-containing protein [Obelidium mucronatum]|nr:X-domain of DnaJ-containing-domain-containing protein [Obelidium mucronatum]
MAMLYHPDKSDDPEAESKFKLVSEAYQVLSDPQRRAAYDRNGKPSKESGGASFMDPQEFFQQQFGGDKFLDIIGEISLARDLKGMSNVPNEDQKHQQLTLQERIQIRTARVERLAQKLREKLDRYVNAFPVSQPSHNIKEPVGSWGAWDKPGIGNISWTSAQMDYEIDEAAFAQQSQDRALREFRQEIQREAADLKSESFGIELLHSIGFTYSLKAAQFQAKLDEDQGSSFYTRWMGRWKPMGWCCTVTNCFPVFQESDARNREKAHIVSETVETIKTAIDMQSSFAKIQELDKKSSSTGNKDQTNSSDPFEDRDRSKLEKEAAEKGLHAIWRGSKLEIESVLRDVCDTVFLESNEKVMDLEIYKRRVDALGCDW